MRCAATFSSKDSQMTTAVHVQAAAERGHVETVKALLACGASPNALDHRNWTCLHWAACNNHVEVLKELAAAGGDVGARDTKGNTALHMAVTAGALHAAVALVEELGADPNALNNKEESPLPGLKELLMPQVVSAGGQNLQGAVGEGDAAEVANGGPHGASPAPVTAPC
jgi:ankyrin repeat protein